MMPADTGVEGLVEILGEGSGSDAELSRPSRDFISSADGLVTGASEGRDFAAGFPDAAPSVDRGVRGRGASRG